MKRLVLVLALACGVLAAGGVEAYAYREPNTMTGTTCAYCHPTVWVNPPGVWSMEKHASAGGECADCHGDPGDGYAFGAVYGPHGGYVAASSKCDNCHTIHAAPAGRQKLLPGLTIKDTCFSCHDGTGGWGVYGTIKARTGLNPGAVHSYESTANVPGGNPSTGGSAIGAFKGTGGTLTCNDCHSPHGQKVVAAFQGDRRRIRSAESPDPVSTKLLKRRPTGASQETTAYGSDWCLGCHAGRASGGTAHNHPVDSRVVTATPFNYSYVAILSSTAVTGATTYGPLGGVPMTTTAHSAVNVKGGNRGYMMPYPRTPQQAGHKPICQQCHEDAREPGMLYGATAQATTATINTADGVRWSGSAWVPSGSDNPQFQNFPHETQNRRLLVELDDDLCFNCHVEMQLP